MILFITLCLIAIAVAVMSILVLSAAGASFILVFGDLIVGVFMIVWFIKKKKEKKKD